MGILIMGKFEPSSYWADVTIPHHMEAMLDLQIFDAWKKF